jgi:hypothetical protein
MSVTQVSSKNGKTKITILSEKEAKKHNMPRHIRMDKRKTSRKTVKKGSRKGLKKSSRKSS